jgi:acetoin utilization deacetylase AcuC-like enzyme
LRERDRAVFAWARHERLPTAWVLAGGYTQDVKKIVDVHLGTFEAAVSVYGA